MTVVPPLTGPASRVTLPPLLRTAWHAAAASGTSMAMWPYAFRGCRRRLRSCMSTRAPRLPFRRRSRRTRVCIFARAGRWCAALSCRAPPYKNRSSVRGRRHAAWCAVFSSQSPLDRSEFEQFVVFLARAAVGTRPVRRNVLPFGAGRYLGVWVAEGLVVDVAADETHVFFHSGA